jgi:hypothetical protein
MVRMLIVAYCYGIRFERRLCWVSLALSGIAVACIGLLSRRSLKLKANDVWHGPPTSALAS